MIYYAEIPRQGVISHNLRPYHYSRLAQLYNNFIQYLFYLFCMGTWPYGHPKSGSRAVEAKNYVRNLYSLHGPGMARA